MLDERADVARVLRDAVTPSLDGDAPCPRKSSATTRWPAASASMLRPKKWRDMQTPCRSTSGGPEPTSVTATLAPVESPIRFSVIPVPSLTVTVAVQAHEEALVAAREVAAEIAPRADLHDREGSFSQENIDALWRRRHRQPQPPRGPRRARARTCARPPPRCARRRGRRAPPRSCGSCTSIYLQVRRRPFGLDPAVRAPRLRLRAGGAGAHQRAAGRARARHARARRGARDRAPCADRRERLPGPRAQDLLHRQLRACSWMIVWAATAEDDPAGQRGGPFLVPADAPGITIVETWDHLGMRATASHDVVLRGRPIPPDHAAALLPRARRGPPLPHRPRHRAG